jgi:dihydroneopterin aldolase
MAKGLITGDSIHLSRIGIFAYHGVYEEEGRLGQRFYISLSLGLDLGPAGRADDLNLTVSYADIATRVQEIAVGQRYQIIEALGEAIAQDLLATYPQLREVVVEVEKPHAAVMAILETLSVTIHRKRAG